MTTLKTIQERLDEAGIAWTRSDDIVMCKVTNISREVVLQYKDACNCPISLCHDDKGTSWYAIFLTKNEQ
jgi:hypothetical protein